MIQVLPQESLGSLLGGALGEGLGQGLGAGLQALAASKLSNLQRTQELEQQRAAQRELAQRYQEAGLSPAFAFLPEGVQKSVLANQAKENQLNLIKELLGGAATDHEDDGAGSEKSLLGLELLKPGLGNLALGLRKEQRAEKTAERSESKPFREKIEEQAQGAQETERSLNEIEDAVRSGEVGPLSRANVAESLGKFTFIPGVPALQRALLTPKAAAFKTASKQIFSGAKDIFGARVTNLDAQIFQEMLPQIGRSEAANLASIDVLRAQAEARVEKAKILSEVQAESPNISGAELKAEVNRRYESYLDQAYDKIRRKVDDAVATSGETVKIVLPDGKKGTIPAANLRSALEKGAKLQ